MLTALLWATLCSIAAINLYQAWRARRAAKAARRAELATALEWKAALASAHIAHAQAKAIGEASGLLCEDCTRIVSGYYEQDAGPRTREWLAENTADA